MAPRQKAAGLPTSRFRSCAASPSEHDDPENARAAAFVTLSQL